ncbi:MAG: site-specific DNA-methyltransferase [Actinomycetota bacterium]|nr:site-specific DNA-methyltransferase [Actinomycetota bacterium]
MSRPAALAREIDLELSWSERELPERERTKHVHRLHPYLGKFVPQLAEVFLRRFGRAGTLVWDPFVGSGTTLVEANALGMPSAGCDLSAFNCLLARVKTAPYDGEAVAAEADALIGRLGELRRASPHAPSPASPYLERWFAPGALRDLLAFRERLEEARYRELWAVVLSRAARSARLARHDDLDFPREPVRGDYFCHKHRRVCHPVREAEKFLRRYVEDAVRRVAAFADLRTDADVTVLAGDARVIDPPGSVDLVLTSPPYPGLIDYHEQHAYAFELLGLERRDVDEIGRGLKGYCRDVAAVLRRAARALPPRGRVVIVVNDSRGLYDGILAEANLELEERLLRHVNRRTGRRNGEYYEEVLIARP